MSRREPPKKPRPMVSPLVPRHALRRKAAMRKNKVGVKYSVPLPVAKLEVSPWIEDKFRVRVKLGGDDAYTAALDLELAERFEICWNLHRHQTLNELTKLLEGEYDGETEDEVPQSAGRDEDQTRRPDTADDGSTPDLQGHDQASPELSGAEEKVEPESDG